MTVHIKGDGGHAKVIRDMLLDWPHAEGAIVAVGDNRARKREVEKLREERFFVKSTFMVLRHPSAIISRDASVGAGTVIMAGVIIQAGARIGEHCILNTGCTVDHDCVVEDFAHIAPGAHLCGGVKVGEGALVGVGVGIAPNAVIPPWNLARARSLELQPI